MDGRSDSTVAQKIIGPWLVGTMVDIYLFGILTVQFIQYWAWYRDDRLSLRLAVVGLQVLAFLKSVECFVMTWVQCIKHMNDLEGALQLHQTAWWEAYNGLLVTLSNLYVQLYFCYRLWVISQRVWWPFVPIITLLLASLGGALYGSLELSKSWTANQVDYAFAIHLTTALAADILLSTTTAFSLLRSQNGAEIKNSVARALFPLTIQAQVPAVLCAFLNLVFSQVYAADDNLVAAVFNQSLPKIYGISMMWTLNERWNIRSGVSYAFENSINDLSLPEFRTMDISNIEISTRTEIVEHIRDCRIRDQELDTNPSVSCPLQAFEPRSRAVEDAGISRSSFRHTVVVK